MGKQKFYYAFFWLSLIIVVMYIFQLAIPGYTELYLLNKNALSGEVWRYVTSIFMHAGHAHLIFNLFALLLFGFILEKLIGTKKFLIVFFGSGIFANIISVYFYNASLGASGAIYGILGAVTILRPTMLVWVYGLIMPMFAAAILWIIADLIGVFYPSGTGNIAHLSGILFGVLMGFVIRRVDWHVKKKPRGVVIPESQMRMWERQYMGR